MAVSTEADLCNISLGMLGQPGISALVSDPETATSKAQKWCSRLYPFARDNLLEAHPWFWASSRAALTEDTAHPPTWGYGHAFTLPADYLRLAELPDNDQPFTIENHPIYGKRMLTDMTSASIRYVWKITDVTLFPNFFVKALARQLAAELAYPLTGEKDLNMKLLKFALAELEQAQLLDYGCELSQPLEDEDSWLMARR
jgi:hypothetical protein